MDKPYRGLIILLKKLIYQKGLTLIYNDGTIIIVAWDMYDSSIIKINFLHWNICWQVRQNVVELIEWFREKLL